MQFAAPIMMEQCHRISRESSNGSKVTANSSESDNAMELVGINNVNPFLQCISKKDFQI